MAETAKVRFESRMLIEASGVGRQNGHAGFDQHIELKSVAYPVA